MCHATGPVIDRLTEATLTTRMSEEPLVLQIQKNFASHTRPDSSQKTRLTSKQTCMLQDTRTLSPTRDGSHRALRDSWALRETALQLAELGLPRSANKSSQKFAHAGPNALPQRCLSNPESPARQQNVRQTCSATRGTETSTICPQFPSKKTCGIKLATSTLSFETRGTGTTTIRSATHRCTRSCVGIARPPITAPIPIDEFFFLTTLDSWIGWEDFCQAHE